MQNLWLIWNPASGSTDANAGEAFAAAAAVHGLQLVGSSRFPEDSPPTAADLEAAGVDTLAILAGDGTINAVSAALDDWDGQLLALPGGTMNVLPHLLHGKVAWPEVLAAAVAGAPATPLPFACVGEARALVGLIIGPAAAWVHARERWRAGRIAALWRALGFAWRKSFARTIRIDADPRHRGPQRAVLVLPGATGLEVASFAAADWVAVARIGWNWLAGDWRAAPGVNVGEAAAVVVTGAPTISLLVDGELVKQPSPVRVSHGVTRVVFVRTLAAEAAGV